jgi:hypothetical protein
MLLFHRNHVTPWAEARRFAPIMGMGAAMSTWAPDEFAMADLGDGRLNKWLIKLVNFPL